MYALNLSDDNRILSATFGKFAQSNAAIVETLPDGDISEYLYVDGEYVYSPLPKPAPVVEPTKDEQLRADLDYLAIMTGVEL